MHSRRSSRTDIVCLPDMEWDNQLWTNRQHMMQALPHVDPTVHVLYVSPPRFPVSHRTSGRTRSPGPSQRAGVFVRRVHQRLHILQPLIPVPNRAALAHAPRLLDALAVATTLTLLRRLGMRPDLAWVYGPGQYRILEAIAPTSVCYDLVDDYLAQPNYHSRQAELRTVHDRLLRRADVVLATSSALAEMCRRDERVHMVGNAADVEHFRRARRDIRQRPSPLGPRGGGPIIGFYGALASHKLDLDLIVAVAAMRPGWRFAFVGPLYDSGVSSALASLPNVVLVGVQDPEALLDYVAHFDAAWVPYAPSRYMRGVNPLKLYELISAGTPTVVAGAQVPSELSNVLPHVDSPTGAVEALTSSLGSAGIARARIGSELASRFSWESKARRCLDIVNAARR